MSDKKTSLRLYSWVSFAFICAALLMAYKMYANDIKRASVTDAQMAEIIEGEVTVALNDYPPMPEPHKTENVQVSFNIQKDTPPNETAVETAALAETLNSIEPTMGSAVEENVSTDTNLYEDTPYLRAIGNPDAPIIIEEYSALTCGHCAKFHHDTLPALKEKYIDTGKVYMIFKPFPLSARDMEGSMILTCMDKSRHYDFMNLLFETAGQWAFGKDREKALKQNAKLAGMTDEEFNSCLKNKEIKETIALGMKEAGSEYGVNSTPTFIINNGETKIRGAESLSHFENVIEGLLDKAEKAPAE